MRVDRAFLLPQLSLDMAALLGNWRRYAALPVRVAAVVKANAYGLGAERIVPELVGAGCRHFYVATIDEGVRIRADAGAEAIINVLDGPDIASIAVLLEHGLTPVLNSLEQIALWRETGNNDAILHLDTGMNRLGLPETDWAQAHSLWPLPRVLMSHLACANSPDHALNRRQYECFAAIATSFPKAEKSLAGSYGAALGAEYWFDEIRPGIGLYGGGPELGGQILPTARLTAAVLQTRLLWPGSSSGYDASYSLPESAKPEQLACLGIGYADGLLRSCSNRGYAIIQGEKRRIIGRVSMDLTMIDSTGLDLETGMRAELFGPALPLNEQADSCGLIAYELLTAIGPRVQHV